MDPIPVNRTFAMRLTFHIRNEPRIIPTLSVVHGFFDELDDDSMTVYIEPMIDATTASSARKRFQV